MSTLFFISTERVIREGEVTMKCPYCGEKAVYMTSKEFYGKDYGTSMYVCKPCDARVGTHGRSERALGTMANKELRELRMQCHSQIDPYWKTRTYSRASVYSRLQEVLGITKDEAHIGLFDEERCRLLLDAIKRDGFFGQRR